MRAAPDGGVLADPARLLRLRRHAHRTRARGLGDAGDEQQHHALHRHDGRFGAQRDRGVRRRPARARRHHRRQRPVPDRDARQRHPLLQADLPRRRSSSRSSTSRRTSSTWADRFPVGSASRSGPSTRTGSCSRRGRSTRPAKPVQETWSLIFDNVRFGEILYPDMQTVCAELDSASGCCSRRSSATASRPYTVRCAMSATRPPSGSPRGSRACPTAPGRARRSSTATVSTTRRSTGSASRVTKHGGPARGRLQRHLTPGAHVHQRDRARREDVRRASR